MAQSSFLSSSDLTDIDQQATQRPEKCSSSLDELVVARLNKLWALTMPLGLNAQRQRDNS